MRSASAKVAGTAIWTKMAQAYANICMSVLERQLLDDSPLSQDVWLRYIDDIFMVRTYVQEALDVSMTRINPPTPLSNIPQNLPFSQ